MMFKDRMQYKLYVMSLAKPKSRNFFKKKNIYMTEKTINILAWYKDMLFYDKIIFSEAIDRQKQ